MHWIKNFSIYAIYEKFRDAKLKQGIKLFQVPHIIQDWCVTFGEVSECEQMMFVLDGARQVSTQSQHLNSLRSEFDLYHHRPHIIASKKVQIKIWWPSLYMLKGNPKVLHITQDTEDAGMLAFEFYKEVQPPCNLV